MEQYLIPFNDMEWMQTAPGIRSKAFLMKEWKLRLVEFSDKFVEEDWCKKGHIGYVLEGRLNIDFHGAVIAIKAGDALHIPEGEAHKHKPIISKGERALLVMFEKSS